MMGSLGLILHRIEIFIQNVILTFSGSGLNSSELQPGYSIIQVDMGNTFQGRAMHAHVSFSLTLIIEKDCFPFLHFSYLFSVLWQYWYLQGLL